MVKVGEQRKRHRLKGSSNCINSALNKQSKLRVEFPSLSKNNAASKLVLRWFSAVRDF